MLSTATTSVKLKDCGGTVVQSRDPPSTQYAAYRLLLYLGYLAISAPPDHLNSRASNITHADHGDLPFAATVHTGTDCSSSRSPSFLIARLIYTQHYTEGAARGFPCTVPPPSSSAQYISYSSPTPAPACGMTSVANVLLQSQVEWPGNPL